MGVSEQRVDAPGMERITIATSTQFTTLAIRERDWKNIVLQKRPFAMTAPGAAVARPRRRRSAHRSGASLVRGVEIHGWVDIRRSLRNLLVVYNMDSATVRR
jgi:hypothetical protein